VAPASLSHCTAARDEAGADNATLEERTRVYFVIPREDDTEAGAAAGAGAAAAAAAAAAAGTGIAAEAAADKRQVAVRNPVDSAADTAEGVVTYNSGVDNPAGYTAVVVHIPVVVAPAEVR